MNFELRVSARPARTKRSISLASRNSSARAFVLALGHHDETGQPGLDAMQRTRVQFLAEHVTEIQVDRLVEGEADSLLGQLATRFPPPTG